MSYNRYNRFAKAARVAKTEMISKFNSICRGCQGQITAGNKIVRNKARLWVCENCAETEVAFAAQPSAPGYAIGARVRTGRCEDAPCCGCCGPQGDGDYYGQFQHDY